MSILSDLAPQNTQLPIPRVGANPNRPGWLAIMLLLAGVPIWLYYGTAGSPGVLGALSTPMAAVPSTVERSVGESEANEADPRQTTIPMPLHTGEAVINVSPPQSTTPNPRPSARPVIGNSNRTEWPMAHDKSVTRTEKLTTTAAPAKSGRESSIASAGKTKKSTRVAAPQSNPKAATKALARDIDIISIMVR